MPRRLMVTKSLDQPEVNSAMATAIRSIESQTSIEVVIAMRPRADHYRDIDYLLGLVGGLLGLLFYLVAPWTFADEIAILAVSVGFVAGSLLSLGLPVARWCARATRQRQAVRRLAQSLFVELGIHRTRRRTGLLFLICLLERKLELVHDVGFDPIPLGQDWLRATTDLSTATQRGDADAFIAQLTALGPVLAAVYPRAIGDTNELSDEVQG